VEQETLVETVGRWAGRRVLVLGDALLDGWLSGAPARLCREAPVAVLDVAERRNAPGGAANTAMNLAALGANVELVAAAGLDEPGDLLYDALVGAGVATRLVRVPGRRTLTKRRLLAGDQIIARFDEGDADALDDPAALLAVARAALDSAPEAVAVCDYGAGTVPDALVALLATWRQDIPLLAVDAHDLGRWRAVRPDLVTPSLAEAARLLGDDEPAAEPVVVELDVDRPAWAAGRLAAVRAATGARIVALTMDVDGALVLDDAGAVHRTGTTPAPGANSAGAGDSYLSGFLLALLSGAPAGTAARVAQAAASTVLCRPGTSVCGVSDLLDRLAPAPPGPVCTAELVARVHEARARGARVVFTNGCFDVLHRGHVGYLSQARELGDLLVVAVNSDDSVRRLKGPSRPVNPQEDRAAVLAALGCVDHVVVFDEDSPQRLLELVRPDVYVKGGDYRPELIPEAELVHRLGGEVRTLDYLPDRSTSAIIDRIRRHEPLPATDPSP
jgi:rfaE bifunctional protein nucleotidyltransferase chain/domain/rfaE bifunctional protein kinase chain/domain